MNEQDRATVLPYRDRFLPVGQFHLRTLGRLKDAKILDVGLLDLGQGGCPCGTLYLVIDSLPDFEGAEPERLILHLEAFPDGDLGIDLEYHGPLEPDN